jgi:hypothetical protein
MPLWDDYPRHSERIEEAGLQIEELIPRDPSTEPVLSEVEGLGMTAERNSLF